jgi:hypothetical protein
MIHDDVEGEDDDDVNHAISPRRSTKTCSHM